MMVSLLSHRETIEAIQTVPWCISIIQNSTRPHNQHGCQNSREFNQALFKEEVQKFQCIYNTFLKDCKNKNVRFNTWKAIREKFGLDAPEVEKRY